MISSTTTNGPTAVLTKIKPYEEENDACNKADKSNKIELGELVTKGAFWRWMNVEEDEQEHRCKSTDRPGAW